MSRNLIFIVTATTIRYINNKNHALHRLILIEFLALTAVIALIGLTSAIKIENQTLMYVLVLIISERVVGLSIMIRIIRTHGNDMLMSSSIIKL